MEFIYLATRKIHVCKFCTSQFPHMQNSEFRIPGEIEVMRLQKFSKSIKSDVIVDAIIASQNHRRNQTEKLLCTRIKSSVLVSISI